MDIWPNKHDLFSYFCFCLVSFFLLIEEIKQRIHFLIYVARQWFVNSVRAAILVRISHCVGDMWFIQKGQNVLIVF